MGLNSTLHLGYVGQVIDQPLLLPVTHYFRVSHYLHERRLAMTIRSSVYPRRSAVLSDAFLLTSIVARSDGAHPGWSIVDRASTGPASRALLEPLLPVPVWLDDGRSA